MLLKLCSKCQGVVPYPARVCPKCREGAVADRVDGKARADKRYNAKRNKEHEAFYKSKPWRMLRTSLFAERGYLCEYCKGIGTEIHHEISIDTPEGWERRLDPTNCKISCIKCHNKQHGRFVSKPGG